MQTQPPLQEQPGTEELDAQSRGPALDRWDELQLALLRLDRLLESALEKVPQAYGPQAGSDSFRGLHLEPEDLQRRLAVPPGEPLLYAGPSVDVPFLAEAGGSRFAWLQAAYRLSPFDLDVLLIGLAPEVDRRYERLYAYLQDDVSLRRPSVDLALNLLCPSYAARRVGHSRFLSAAPLVGGGLVHLLPPPQHPEPTLLAHQIRLDDQVVRLLLDLPGLDSRLEDWCELSLPAAGPADLPLDEPAQRTLESLAGQIEAGKPLPVVYVYGSPGSGRRQAARALAAGARKAFLEADLSRLPADSRPALRLLCREAVLQNALLYLSPVVEEPPAAFHDLLREVSGLPVVLAGSRLLPPDPAHPVSLLALAFPTPAPALRRRLWQSALAEFFPGGVQIEPPELDALAGRFRLTPGQIRSAAAAARAHTAVEVLSGDGGSSLAGALFAAARWQTGHALASLAHKLDPVYTWDDLILPPDSLAQLREIGRRVEYASQVLDAWGFARKLSLGKGVNALFAGPSGTGKTMAAEVLANDLGLDLYRIDLAGVVSKYIGETEKNLDRIFTAAGDANAILFFDEADALFGKRSEVRDSHDRYANIEISYLLQQMEQYAGVAILATNLRQNLDEAFVRRLAFSVHFPFPDAASRLAIWRRVWPPETPLESGLDLEDLAGRFKLSGGNIKNIALAAAFAAAAEGCPVGRPHLLHALRREYQKLGKPLAVEEWGSLSDTHPGRNGREAGER